MSTCLSVHGVAEISAQYGPTTGAPLHIAARDAAGRRLAEISVFVGDPDLSRRLASAIDAAVREHRAATSDAA